MNYEGRLYGEGVSEWTMFTSADSDCHQAWINPATRWQVRRYKDPQTFILCRPEGNRAAVYTLKDGETFKDALKWAEDFISVTIGKSDAVNHPSHYGGADNPYECIRVIEAWELSFCLGNTIKYISRAGKKGDAVEDLEKALWYLRREIERIKKERAR